MDIHGITIDPRDIVPVRVIDGGKRRMTRCIRRNSPTWRALDKASSRALIESMTYSDPARVKAARDRQRIIMPLLREAI